MPDDQCSFQFISYFTDTKNMHILEQNTTYDSVGESSWPAAGTTTGMSFQPKMGKDRMTKDLLLKLMDEDWRELFRKGMECLFMHFNDVHDSNKARWKEVQ